MYCESCKVEFSEGLRYCKWCGQQLSQRSRVTSELHKCHVCGASVQPGWAYCKSCGVRLLGTAPQSEVVCPRCGTPAPAPAAECSNCGQDLTGVPETPPAESTGGAANVYCPSCGGQVEQGATFCKTCGAITAGAASLTTPDLGFAAACPQCSNRNHPGSTHCRVCGTPLAGPREIGSGDLRGRGAAEEPMGRQTLPDLPRQTTKEKLADPSEPGGSDDGTRAVTSRDLTAPRAADETADQIQPQLSGSVAPPTLETRALSSADWSGAGAAEPQPVGSLMPTAAMPDPNVPNGAAIGGMPSPRETSYPLPGPDVGPQRLAVSLGSEPAPDPQLPSKLPSQTAMPAPKKRNASLAIASVAIALIVIGAAGFLVWRYLAGRGEAGRAAASRAAANQTAAAREARGGSGTGAETPSVSSSPDQTGGGNPQATGSAPESMVLVEAGSYTVGRDDGDKYARPSRAVTLPAFYVDRTEVTNSEYKAFVDATGHKAPHGWQGVDFPAGHENWPVTEVTWQDAVDYAAWAGKRLPTEAEWEAAARGPEGRVYPWGDSFRPGMANIKTKGLMEVGHFKEGASPVGALDMIGNVWEWTADEFKLYPGSKASLPDVMKPGVTYRVIRGGAYDCNEKNDASYRGFVDATEPLDKTGFRCVKDISK